MRRPRGGQMMLLGDVLRAAFERASMTVFGDRVALYLVGLKDEAGFALALAIHAKVQGPDPAILRERSQGRGVRKPLMIGAAPVEVLARVVEELGGGGGSRDGGSRGGGKMPGWTIREFHRVGEVPVLVITDGVEVVSTVEALADGEGAELLAEDEEVPGTGGGRPRKGVEVPAAGAELAGSWKGDAMPRNGGVGVVLADEGEPEIGGWVVSPAGEA